MTNLNTPAAWSERARTVADPYAAVHWSEAGQRERFDAVLAALEPHSGESLLDYGCGLGALADRLDPGAVYVGYDWAEGMIERARAERSAPRRLFTTVHPTGRYDLVACVGPFNLKQNWSKRQTWVTLQYLWALTGCRTLAVSLYADTDSVNSICYTEEEVASMGTLLSPKAPTVSRIRKNDIVLAGGR